MDGLVGVHGHLPATDYLARARVRAEAGSPLGGFVSAPGIFWLAASDRFVSSAAWTGVAVSLLVTRSIAVALARAKERRTQVAWQDVAVGRGRGAQANAMALQ